MTVVSVEHGKGGSVDPQVVQWSVESVGPDARSLQIAYTARWRTEPIVAVSETATTVIVDVRWPPPQPEPASTRLQARPLMLQVGRAIVELAEPLNGRAIGGTPAPPSWDPALVHLPEPAGGGWRRLLPLVIGMQDGAARELLEIRGFSVTEAGQGSTVIAQSRDTDGPSPEVEVVTLTVG
jgi:hypothetical protein